MVEVNEGPEHDLDLHWHDVDMPQVNQQGQNLLHIFGAPINLNLQHIQPAEDFTELNDVIDDHHQLDEADLADLNKRINSVIQNFAPPAVDLLDLDLNLP